jgi:hypothetical protein
MVRDATFIGTRRRADKTPTNARGGRRREVTRGMSTSYAFLRGGAIDRAARAGAPWPFLASARDSWGRESDDADDVEDEDARDVEDECARDDDPRASASTSSASVATVEDVEGDGEDDAAPRRYDSARLLALRDAPASRGAPVGTTEEELKAYPWRAIASARERAFATRTETTEDDALDDALDDDALDALADSSTRRSLWDDARAFDADIVDAARSLRRAETRRGRGDAREGVSASFTVTFRAGAVRDFVDAVARDAFGGLTSGSDFSALSREGRAAVLYGTSRDVDGSREIEVAFIHPWDGDASRVAAWLANHAASADSVVSPMGWARATASLGVSLFPDVVRAHENAVTVRKATAASVFMAVDVVASARGPVAMECYDLDARRGVEYFLHGVDAA